MKKLLPILLILFLQPFGAYAQAWQWGRQSTAVADGYVIAHDIQGNVYVAGSYWGSPVFGTNTIAYHNYLTGGMLYSW